MRTKILIADSHRILREGLRALLQKQPGFEVVGEAGNGRTAVSLAKKLRPDVVIMEVELPDLNGIEATRQMFAQAPEVKVLAFTTRSDRSCVTRMLRAGASGYLLKDSPFEDLMRAIRAALANQTYLSPEVTAEVIVDYRRQSLATDSADATILTARKREVLQLLAEGKTTKEMARLLYVSVKTIETHRKQIMDLLGLHSVAGLTKYAVREGITSLEK